MYFFALGIPHQAAGEWNIHINVILSNNVHYPSSFTHHYHILLMGLYILLCFTTEMPGDKTENIQYSIGN